MAAVRGPGGRGVRGEAWRPSRWLLQSRVEQSPEQRMAVRLGRGSGDGGKWVFQGLFRR